MFKKLVEIIASIATLEDFNYACGRVDRAFQDEKISWSDHQLLYKLLSLLPDFEDEN